MDQWNLLVIDDDDLIPASLRFILPDHWKLKESHSFNTALLNQSPDLAFIDMHLNQDFNQAEGIEVIKKIKKLTPHCECVAISGDFDIKLMEKALEAGATRFLSKPLIKDEVLDLLQKMQTYILLKKAKNTHFQSKIKWVGESKESEIILKKIAEINHEKGHILIEGETGVGKEVLAQLIHSLNPKQNFISVNVSSLPDSLFESEFFGHTKGAFTGAVDNKFGLAELAQGGSLFLDEIEALPLSQQAKLLRFIESGEIRRVGGKDSIRVETRIIAASNIPLDTLVKSQRFREDLYFRLKQHTLFIPPLRKRKEDIKPLANYFIHHLKPRTNKTLHDEALEVLKNYPFPGNIRELKRIIEQAALVSPLPIIRKEDILPLLQRLPLDSNNSGYVATFQIELGLEGSLVEAEKKWIEAIINDSEDLEKARSQLKLPRSSLYKKIKEHKITLK